MYNPSYRIDRIVNMDQGDFKYGLAFINWLINTRREQSHSHRMKCKQNGGNPVFRVVEKVLTLWTRVVTGRKSVDRLVKYVEIGQ